jgi:hypothetical protein
MKKFSEAVDAGFAPAIRTLVLAVASTLGAVAPVHAFEFDTGIPDVSTRWDNTFRYNLANRMQSPDPAILASPNNDDGDRNFRNGIVTDRLDILSEFDFVFQKRYGFRLSGTAWYDDAYNHLENQNVSTSNHIVNGAPSLGLSDYTERYYRGPSGELLDAFVFGNFNVGDVGINVKAGRYNVFWGEALLNPIHALSYGQSSLDIGKLLATPGAEAKELFRPRQQVSAQIQATDTLSFAGQYYLSWNQVRYPESGSYLAPNDAVLGGGESLYIGTNRALRGTDITPQKNGDWGLSARWSPEVLDATFGVYYRNTSDIQPQLIVVPGAAALPSATCSALGFKPISASTCYINPSAASPAQLKQGNIGQYMASYASGIDIIGLSFTKQVLGVSVSADLNYRQNMPLTSVPVQVLPAALAGKVPGAITALPQEGDTAGARGNTWHLVTDFAGIVPQNKVFDTANYVVEFVWSTWDKVTQNPTAFTGASTYTGIDKPTKAFLGTQVNFTPTWYQVLPGIDLSAPLSWSMGLVGNSAVTFGGNKGNGNFGIGLGADVQQKYRFDLKYVGYVGRIATNAADQVTSSAGLASLLRDRDYLALTFKTTF